ncbi:hypothetical protein [Sphingomonas sp.]|uniref:hypothetical protein n=1 Tax=Sphingomonas sp. TaxID=28214 RepID=UPI003CC51632
MAKRRHRHRPAPPPCIHPVASPEDIDAALTAGLNGSATLTPEQHQAEFHQLVTGRVARGEHVPDAMLAAARAGGWVPPDPTSLQLLATGRIGGRGWTPAVQRAFLLHLAENGVVAAACRHVGLSKQSANALRSRHPASVFAILWDVAVRIGRRRLLEEATERALHGREEAVWHRGEQVGTRRVFSDRLLMCVLTHEPPPAHPNLSQRELEDLWSTLLNEVDAELPPSVPLRRIAELKEPSGDEA